MSVGNPKITFDIYSLENGCVQEFKSKRAFNTWKKSLYNQVPKMAPNDEPNKFPCLALISRSTIYRDCSPNEKPVMYLYDYSFS